MATALMLKNKYASSFSSNNNGNNRSDLSDQEDDEDEDDEDQYDHEDHNNTATNNTNGKSLMSRSRSPSSVRSRSNSFSPNRSGNNNGMKQQSPAGKKLLIICLNIFDSKISFSLKNKSKLNTKYV